jgi:hypothetical protein
LLINGGNAETRAGCASAELSAPSLARLAQILQPRPDWQARFRYPLTLARANASPKVISTWCSVSQLGDARTRRRNSRNASLDC